MIMLLGLLPLACHATGAATDSLLVVSWNVENFLDYRSDTTGRHTSSRFYSKCNAICKTLLLIASAEGRLPDAVALMEVGDRFVLDRLIRSTALRKLDYRIVHYESPDRRGIDCALLYRKSTLDLLRSSPHHLRDSCGAVLPTRDILLCEFDILDILVNHHPSKVGAGSGKRRMTAMARMNAIVDSLTAEGHCRILCTGDFNDDLWQDGSPGTIKYNGDWEKIDGHFARGLTVKESVFDDACLTEADRSWGGTKPRRTFVGPRYNGGVSDHYPLVLRVEIPGPAEKDQRPGP